MYHIVFRYKLCTHALICACAWKKRKVTTLLSFVIALLQHRNTQRATNKPQAVTLIHKQCHDHWIIVTKLSKTVHLTLVHIARFYWTDSTGHSQKYRDKIGLWQIVTIVRENWKHLTKDCITWPSKLEQMLKNREPGECEPLISIR